MEAREIEISTNCFCMSCPECHVGYSEEGLIKCPECDTELKYPGECFDCQPFDWAQESFEEWVEATGARYIRIDGFAMGWMRRSGYAITDANWKKFIDTMTFNGDWTIRLKFKGEGLVSYAFTATRSSHDEPTGASFEIYPLSACEECGEAAVFESEVCQEHAPAEAQV